MINRARFAFRVAVCLGLFVLCFTALALWHFADDPVQMVFETADKTAVQIPGGQDRLIYGYRRYPFSGRVPVRSLSLERAGQILTRTDLFAAREPFAPIDVYFVPSSPQSPGPFVYLEEPGGAILVDIGERTSAFGNEHEQLRKPVTHRLVRTEHGMFLTSPAGDGRLGVVFDSHGEANATQGRTLEDAGMSAFVFPSEDRLSGDDAPGFYLLGRIEGGSSKKDPLVFVPASRRANP